MAAEFLMKKGVVINNLASDLLQLKQGDRVSSISECQERYGVSRGTIQNAFDYLKDVGAIKLVSRGHLGTFLDEVDYSVLQEYALSETILGTMTLPYSRIYEGMATAIYDVFKDNNIDLNLAYIRGSKERIRSISAQTYRFAIISKFAAEYAIQQGEPIEIIMDFGAKSYLSEHVLLFSNKDKTEIEDGMKVAIDYSSIDQQMLTKELVGNHHVQLVSLPGHQIVVSLKKGIIDAGIWNYDEIRDKDYKDLNFISMKESKLETDMSTSVVVTHKEDSSIKAFFDKSVDKEKILSIQNKVLEGDIIPQY